MKLLAPIGVLLIVIGAGGSIAACFGNSIFDGEETQTAASQMREPADTPANATADRTPRLYLAPLAGLALAVGLVCVGIGIGNWRRPVPSEVRPANPWSDQPAEHGDPPRGIV
jgi:hypothetical protein